MDSALYTRDILRLAAAIPCHQRLTAPQGSATRTSALCGSRVSVDVTLDATGKIIELGQEVRACALGQASAALMAAAALGRTADDLAEAREALRLWLGGERGDPGPWPGLDRLAPAIPARARHGAVLLAFEAAADAAVAAGNAGR